MLCFPEVLTHRGVVVYPDDEDCNLIYLLQGVPHLRQDQSGPVFRATFWTDAADGAVGAVAGLRGALINFDVDLAVPDDVREEIRKLVEDSGIREDRRQIMEREERERLERLARARGEPFEPNQLQVQEIRPVRFGSLRVTSGKAVLLQEQSGGFVAWSSAGGPPSMIGDNNAAFAMRLGAEGAAVWHGALQQDAAAISVRFELTLEARLPSLQIHIWAGSVQTFELERTAERIVENRDEGCSDKDVERVDMKTLTQTLTEEGLLNIEIIKGSAKITDEHVSQLRTMAINLMSDRVKEILMSRIKGITDEERKSSLVTLIKEQVKAFAELRLTQRDVIEWPAAPQATIADFFRGLSRAERERHMVVVDLSDPVVSTLEADVSVIAEWDGPPRIAKVQVSVEYPPAGDLAHKEVILDKDNSSTKLFWRRVRRGSERLTYSAQAFVEGSATPIRLKGGFSNGAILITVPRLGHFKATVRAHPDTFTGKGAGAVTSVQVDYSYQGDSAPDHRAGSLLLRPDNINEGVVIEETTFREIDAPLMITTTYLRKDAPAFQPPDARALWLADGEGQMQLPNPWPDSLRIRAEVAPNLPGLMGVSVELIHEDADRHFTSEGSLELDKDGDWQAATVLVQARQEMQKFRYRYAVRGADQLTRGPWLDGEGDQTLTLPVLAAQIRTQLLGIGQAFQFGILKMRYEDPARRFTAEQEFFLQAGATAPIWLIPRADAALDDYSFTLDLFRQGGEQLTTTGTGSGTNLVLTPPA